MNQIFSKKYTLLSILSILIIFVFFILTDIYFTCQKTNQQMLTDAKNSSIYIEEYVNEIVSILEGISKNPVMRSNDSDKITEFLYATSHFAKINGLALASPQGIRWAGSRKNIKPFDLSTFEVFKGVMTTGKPYVAGVQKSALFDELEFIVGYPILDKNQKIENVFYAPALINIQFKSIFNKINLQSGGTLHLIDGNGYLLLSSDENIHEIKKYDYNNNFKGFFNSSILHNFNTQKLTTTEVNVDGTPWKVMIHKNIKDIIKIILKVILFDTGIIILILLPVIVLFYIFLAQLDKQKRELLDHNSILKNLSTTDGLTGLLNHRSFQESLANCIDQHASNGNSLTLLMLDIDNFKIFNDQYGHQVGDRVLQHLSKLLALFTEGKGIVARYGGEEFVIILNNTESEKAAEDAQKLFLLLESSPIMIAENTSVTISVSLGASSYPKDASDRENLIRYADQALYCAKEKSSNKIQMYYNVFEELRDNIEGEKDLIKVINTLNTIINAKDKYTFAHSERVRSYAEKIGINLGLHDEEIKNIRIGALLHDIGKIEISGEILTKPDKLTPEEFELIKKHPFMGAEIVKPVKSLEKASEFILYHHERYDGKGYPFGLKGDTIPLLGRIAAVADCFDAITTKRPYQNAKTEQEALNEITRCSGSQFDPLIVRSLIEILDHTEDLKLTSKKWY